MATKTLPEIISHYRLTVSPILASPPPSYLFTSVEAYEHLLTKEQFALANCAYILELLSHAHIAALVSLRRNFKWIEGIHTALLAANYFTFSACLRGLIESAADSYFSLSPALAGAAHNFSLMKRAIARQETDRIISFQQMEDPLIHFLQAGRYDDKSKPEEHFRANKSIEYIAGIDEVDPSKPIYALYQKLCQILHPARESAWIFVTQNEDKTWKVRDIQDATLIEGELLKTNGKTFEILFQKSLNASLLTLYFLDALDPEYFPCPPIREINFTGVDGFTELKKRAGLV